MMGAIRVEPIPVSPVVPWIYQLEGGDADDLWPGAPIISEGPADVTGPVLFINGRITRISPGVELVAGFADKNLEVRASMSSQKFQLRLVAVNHPHIRRSGCAFMEVEFRRAVNGVRVCSPKVKGPEAIGHCGEHLLHEVQRRDITRRGEGGVEHNNSRVTDAANGAGGLFQELAILGGVDIAAPFFVYIGLVPNLDVEPVSGPSW